MTAEPLLSTDDLWLLLIVGLGLLLVIGAMAAAVAFCEAPLGAVVGQQVEQQPVVHACPPEGSGLTPCCQRSPLELPWDDRLTTYGPLVTCGGSQ